MIATMITRMIVLLLFEIGLSKIPKDTLNISWSNNFKFTSDEISNPQFIFMNDNEFLLCYQDNSLSANPVACQLGLVSKNGQQYSNIQYSSQTIYHSSMNSTNNCNINIMQQSKTNCLLSVGSGQILQANITNSNITFNNKYFIYDSNHLHDESQLLSITDDEFVICYSNDNNADKTHAIYCKYGIIGNENNIMFGPEAQVISPDDAHKNAPRMFSETDDNIGNKILKLSDTQFVICYIAIIDSNTYGYCSIGNIDRSKIGKNNATINYMTANAFNTQFSGTDNINLFNYDPEFDIIICYTVNDNSVKTQNLTSLGLCSMCLLHNQNGFFPNVACPGVTFQIVRQQNLKSITTSNILYHYVSSAVALEGELLACFGNMNQHNSYCEFGHIYVDGDGADVILFHDAPQFLDDIVSGVQVSLFPTDSATHNQRDNEFVFNNFYVLLCYHTDNSGQCRIGSITGTVTDDI